MNLNSPLYIGFLALSCILYWTVPHRYRQHVLIGTGIFFVGYHSLVDVLILMGLSLLTYCCIHITRNQKPETRNIVFGITALILILAFFKYAHTVLSLLQNTHEYTSTPFDGTQDRRIFEYTMPLGLSYITFELLHVLIEAKRGTIKDLKLVPFLTFAWFFPTRSAGPIKRFPAFATQLTPVTWKPTFLLTGIALITLGFAQKIIIADNLVLPTQVLSTPQNLQGPLDAALSLTLYSVRIYADFTGLTNVAMGSAILFGILVPKNFLYPYLRPNIAEFWRTWHMSLSHFARDYIYIPLGGSQKGTPRTLLNLLLIMLIIGIWHGSSSNFAVWGLWHGVGLGIHRLWRQSLGAKVPQTKLTYTFGMIITCIFVTIGWAFFVTTNVRDSLIILQTLFFL